jgi:hypothetical protein
MNDSGAILLLLVVLVGAVTLFIFAWARIVSSFVGPMKAARQLKAESSRIDHSYSSAIRQAGADSQAPPHTTEIVDLRVCQECGFANSPSSTECLNCRTPLQKGTA